MPYTSDGGTLVDGTSNCGLLRVRLSLPPEWHFESAQRSNHNIISILLKEAAVSVVGEAAARSISILGDPEPGGAPRPPGKRQSSLSCRYQPERAALGRPPGGGLGLVI